MTLEKDLLRLKALDRDVVRALMESRPEALHDALTAYMELRANIRTTLLDQSIVSVMNPDAASVLRKTITGPGLPTDNIIKDLLARLRAGDPDCEFDELDFETLAEKHFNSVFSCYEYVMGLAELRPLVVRTSVSDIVSALVNQVRECYVFQIYDATYAMCRTVIEAAIRDICIRKDLFPNLGENVILLEKYRWSDLRAKVSPGELEQDLKKLYGRLSEVVHSRRSVSKREALKGLEDTLQVIERLYEANGL